MVVTGGCTEQLTSIWKINICFKCVILVTICTGQRIVVGGALETACMTG